LVVPDPHKTPASSHIFEILAVLFVVMSVDHGVASIVRRSTSRGRPSPTLRRGRRRPVSNAPAPRVCFCHAARGEAGAKARRGEAPGKRFRFCRAGRRRTRPFTARSNNTARTRQRCPRPTHQKRSDRPFCGSAKPRRATRRGGSAFLAPVRATNRSTALRMQICRGSAAFSGWRLSFGLPAPRCLMLERVARNGTSC
jgi:hypothetical protein